MVGKPLCGTPKLEPKNPMNPTKIGQLLPTITSALTATPQRVIAKSARNFPWGWLETGLETRQELTELRQMLHEAQQFVSDVMTGQSPRWLFYCGRSGTGKSHLAHRIADALKKWGEWCYNTHGRPVLDPKKEHYQTTWSYAQSSPIFVKWARVIDAARDGDYQPYKDAANDWFKVIDDVGAEGFGHDRKPTAFVINQLGKLADDRLGKWTVWTSNFGLGELAELFDARISSRMLRDENVVVEVTARDYNNRVSNGY